jgi:predicted negative regulator of RcsB-dependent stress response
MFKAVKLQIIVSIFLIGLFVNAKEKPYIQTKTKKIVVDSITADTNGTLTYKSSTFSQKIKPKDYIYARIPMPKEIINASKKLKAKQYKDAISGLKQAFIKYKYLGWDIFTLYYTAYSLDKMGKVDDALAVLKEITKKPLDDEKLPNYFKAKKLEAVLFIASGKFDQAEEVLARIGEADDPSIFVFVNNSRGDILSKKGKKREALIMYLRTIMFCTKENKKERPEALKKVIAILKEKKNSRFSDFEAILKKEYP